MEVVKIKSADKDYMFEDISEPEISAAKKSRYAAAIDDSDDDLDDDFSDFEIADSDFNSIYDDTH